MAGTYDAGTIKATVDANTRPYTTAMLRAAATTRTATKAMERDSNSASDAVAGLTGNVRQLTQQALNFKAAQSALMIGGIASLIRPAAGAIDALSGGVVIAAKSLTDLQGVVVALPVGLSALAQGFGAVKFATMGMGDALKAYAEGDSEAIREALKNTSAEAGEFAKTLAGLEPEINKIRNAAAEGLFPGLTRGLEAAVQNLPALKNVMAGTAKVMGDLAEEAGRFVGSETFGARFQVLAKRNAELLSAAGHSGIQMADALTLILMKAKPLTDYMGQLITDLGNWVQNTTNAAAATGELTAYFERAVDAFKDWGAIITNTAGFLRELFAGAEGPANEFRDWMVETTAGWKEWSRSAEGAKAIGDFFDRIVPSLKAAGRLFGDLVKAIWDIGNTDAAQQGFIALSEALRTGLLPALKELAEGVGPTMAVSLAKLAEALVRLVNVASFNPFLTLVGALSDLVIVVTKVASAIPGLSQALGLLSAYFVATRIGLVASFASTLLGLGKAATATKTAVLGLTAAWGAYNTTQTTGAAISAANLVQMKLAFARMKAMQGVTQSAVGPTTAMTGATTGLAGAFGVLGKGIGLVAKAGPAALIFIGIEMYSAITKATSAADEFTTALDALDMTSVSGLRKASDILTEMRTEADRLTNEFNQGGGILDFIAANDIEKEADKTQAAITEMSNNILAVSNNVVTSLASQGTAWKGNLNQMIDLMETAGVDLEALAELSGTELTAALAKASTQTRIYYTTQIAADESTKTFYNSMMTLNDELASSAEKADAAEAALFAMTSALTSGEDARMNYAATLDEVNSGLTANNFALTKNGKHLSYANERLREGAGLLQNFRDRGLEWVAAEFAQTEAAKGTQAALNQLNARYRTNYERLFDVIRATGKSKDETRAYMKVLGMVPPKVQTRMMNPGILKRIREGEQYADILNSLDGQSVKSKAELDATGFSTKIQDIQRRTGEYVKKPASKKIDADTRQAKSALSSLERDMKSFISGDYHTIVTVTGVVPSSSDQVMLTKGGVSTQIASLYMGASGGYIAGPGGPTSDSVPALLSNGEYVINAKSVKRYGHMLFDLLNAQKFASGGIAGMATQTLSPWQHKGGGGGGAGAFTAGGGKDYSRTVADLLASLLKEFKGEKNRREKANKELERILKQATKNMERTMKQMVRGMVQSAKEALKEAKRAYRERVSSIKQGVAGFASITQTGGTEYVSGAGLLEEMRARMNLAKTFQSQYGQLDKLGLNAKSLKEIVNLGPQEGARIAGALLEGSAAEVKARIAEVNQLEAAILRIGKSFGTQVATNEGLKKDVKEARQDLRAVERTEVTVKEGAVRVELNLSGMEKDDRQKIKDAVDQAVTKAFRQFIRELKASR